MGVLIYAGIDEAGWGPMLGPFVVARSVVAIAGHDGHGGRDAGADVPCLWKLLGKAVCRLGSDRRRRIAVNDSKKLYTPSAGLAQLERGVLAFAQLAGRSGRTLDELLNQLCDDAASRLPDELWYGAADGGPALPHEADGGQVAIAGSMLSRAAAGAGLSMADMNAAVIYERRFNEIIAATGSKAGCAWQAVSGHLMAIWQRWGEHHPRVVVDRQGGRKVYHELLAAMLPGAEVVLLDESDDVSRYRIEEDGRGMTVSFEVGSEQRHMPVALASMTAKYLRELLMTRYNRFFALHAPSLKPTAGYYSDGQRFIAEIEPVIRALKLDRSVLIRAR
jgi:ribonuclease HII